MKEISIVMFQHSDSCVSLDLRMTEWMALQSLPVWILFKSLHDLRSTLYGCGEARIDWAMLLLKTSREQLNLGLSH